MKQLTSFKLLLFTTIILSASVFATGCQKDYMQMPEQTSTTSLRSENDAINSANNLTTITTHYIGEDYGGGTIFYLNATGTHGLIAMKIPTPVLPDADGDEMNIFVSNLGIWGDPHVDILYTLTGATGQSIGDGKENTRKIIAAQGTGKYAASVCASYRGGGYTDWALASKEELHELYKHRSVVKGIDVSARYWSSTDADNIYAGMEDFSTGVAKTADKASKFIAWPIRSF